MQLKYDENTLFEWTQKTFCFRKNVWLFEFQIGQFKQLVATHDFNIYES